MQNYSSTPARHHCLVVFGAGARERSELTNKLRRSRSSTRAGAQFAHARARQDLPDVRSVFARFRADKDSIQAFHAAHHNALHSFRGRCCGDGRVFHNSFPLREWRAFVRSHVAKARSDCSYAGARCLFLCLRLCLCVRLSLSLSRSLALSLSRSHYIISLYPSPSLTRSLSHLPPFRLPFSFCHVCVCFLHVELPLGARKFERCAEASFLILETFFVGCAAACCEIASVSWITILARLDHNLKKDRQGEGGL